MGMKVSIIEEVVEDASARLTFLSEISVRDCVSRRDKEISFKDFIEKCRTIPVHAERGGTHFRISFACTMLTRDQRRRGYTAKMLFAPLHGISG